MVTKLNEIYKCDTCGNIVEVLHTGNGALECCGGPMKLMAENTTDAATEKHVPVIEKSENGYKVKVGEIEHPMTDEHYIEWIEFSACNKVYRKRLKPNDKPEAEFVLGCHCTDISARAYCNLHGLWKK